MMGKLEGAAAKAGGMPGVQAMMQAPSQAMMDAVSSIRGEAAMSMTTEDSITIAFPGEPPEQLLWDHTDIKSFVFMHFLPCCCASHPLVGRSNKLAFFRQFNMQTKSCPYQVTLNGQLVGKIDGIGPCANGLAYCLCGDFLCSGHVKEMALFDSQGQERFIFAKELFCCWRPCLVCSQKLRPIAECYMNINGCINYLYGTEIQTVTQPIFKGPWSRHTSTSPPLKIGEFVITSRFKPVSLCCATPSMMKVYFRPTSSEGQDLSKEDVALLTMVMQFYRGMPHPWKGVGVAPWHKPLGVACLDYGLGSKYDWKSVTAIMKESSGAAPSAISAAAQGMLQSIGAAGTKSTNKKASASE